MRVLAPISVSIWMSLFGFRLNIGFFLGCLAVRLGFDRHALSFPHERLPKPVSRVSGGKELHVDASRLEARRQLNRLVVVLEIPKGVCQPGAAIDRDVGEF